MFLFHKLRFVHIEMVFPNIYTTHIIISKNETKYTDIDSQSCTSPNYFPTRSISFIRSSLPFLKRSIQTDPKVNIELFIQSRRKPRN
uniref:Uncharacterized protein n=1 Tax=Cannabis sativa TaxID=3483 RepID=A0A803R742_CANSA